MEADFTVKISESALAQMFGTHGIVGKMLTRVGVKFESRGKYYASGNEGGPNVDTGRFRSSLTYIVGSDGGGAYVDCGSDVEYAVFLELGTVYMDPRPSIIPAAREAAQSLGA